MNHQCNATIKKPKHVRRMAQKSNVSRDGKSLYLLNLLKPCQERWIHFRKDENGMK